MTENIREVDGTEYTRINIEPFTNIFKKSEHEEIMDELREIKRKLDRLPNYIPIIPYPYPCPNPWNPYPYPYEPYCPDYPIYVWNGESYTTGGMACT